MKSLKLNETHVLESSNTIFFDVDFTLVLWVDRTVVNKRKITVQDPHLPEEVIHLLPHQTHINILKRNHAQGRTVIVWSAAGHEWATTIVKALELEQYVTLIMGKPHLIVDDVPMEEWLPKTIYIKDDIEGGN